MNECFEAKKQLSSLGIQLEQSRKEIDQKEEEMSNLLEKVKQMRKEYTLLNQNLSSIKTLMLIYKNDYKSIIYETLIKKAFSIKLFPSLFKASLIANNPNFLSHIMPKLNWFAVSTVEGQLVFFLDQCPADRN